MVITADTVLEVFKDYLTEEHLPRDAKVLALMVKPQEQGKFALVVESDWIKPEQPPLVVNFDIRRIYGVGDKA